jgi:hypothetical protein
MWSDTNLAPLCCRRDSGLASRLKEVATTCLWVKYWGQGHPAWGKITTPRIHRTMGCATAHNDPPRRLPEPQDLSTRACLLCGSMSSSNCKFYAYSLRMYSVIYVSSFEVITRVDNYKLINNYLKVKYLHVLLKL